MAEESTDRCPACEKTCDPAVEECVWLQCSSCGKQTFHKECGDTWVKSAGWRDGTLPGHNKEGAWWRPRKAGLQKGMGAFPCPRGALLPESKPCRNRVCYLSPVFAKTLKKKAAMNLAPAPVPAPARPAPKPKAQPAAPRARHMAAAPAVPVAKPELPVKLAPKPAKAPPSLGTVAPRDFIPGMESASPTKAVVQKKRGAGAGEAAKGGREAAAAGGPIPLAGGAGPASRWVSDSPPTSSSTVIASMP
ncbi:hypothetical protein FOA52_009684 [Chlamydomonas sp. UWO 241]|nr:hypothetical protein FOA52_009684 [Chlamydomonas sp. UWO 241]